MRVIIGLALLAVASAQPAQWASSTGPGVLLYGNAYGTSALPSATGTAALAAINVYTSTATSNPQAGGPFAKVTVSNGSGQVAASNVNVGTGTYATTNNYLIQVANNIPYVVFVFNTNTYTGQLQHRWSPNYNPGSGLSVFTYTCDLCSGPNGLTSATACNTPTGPGTVSTTNGVGSSPSSGYLCSSLARTYTFGPLNPGVNGGSLNLHTFAVQLFDLTPLASSYSFQIYRAAPNIIGDPQISGMQGQDFQVHGMPDEVFNMITYPNLQVNARFVYLSNGECHDNFTACFAHPGTYISDEGIRLGSDKIHVRSGSFKKGLTVSVNGQKVSSKTTSVKLGKIELVNHRRVVISTPIMTIQISNSDKFLNQEVALKDTKLLALGSERRSLKDGESFHTEIPLHGLQGQTWRNVEYPSGLEYEGSILDYHVVSGDLFGNDFVFNKFQ